MKKIDTYYATIPKRVSDIAHRFKAVLESDGIDNNELMRTYFGKYWNEFRRFWAQGGEVVEWITFACAPHNSIMFVMYVFKEYPEMMDVIEKDMNMVKGC